MQPPFFPLWSIYLFPAACRRREHSTEWYVFHFVYSMVGIRCIILTRMIIREKLNDNKISSSKFYAVFCLLVASGEVSKYCTNVLVGFCLVWFKRFYRSIERVHYPLLLWQCVRSSRCVFIWWKDSYSFNDSNSNSQIGLKKF